MLLDEKTYAIFSTRRYCTGFNCESSRYRPYDPVNQLLETVLGKKVVLYRVIWHFNSFKNNHVPDYVSLLQLWLCMSRQ